MKTPTQTTRQYYTPSPRSLFPEVVRIDPQGKIKADKAVENCEWIDSGVDIFSLPLEQGEYCRYMLNFLSSYIYSFTLRFFSADQYL